MFKKSLAAAAVVVLSLTVGGALLASVGSFDPNGKPPTKGFVAVEAYKWLRDNAPAAIAGCERTVDQFDDLRQPAVSKFKREAINCLASVGFFDNYPAPTPRLGNDIGAWTYFSGTIENGSAYDAYGTSATSSSTEDWEGAPALFLRCDANDNYEVFVVTPWYLYNNIDAGDGRDALIVHYRFSGAQGWSSTLAAANDESPPAVFLDEFAFSQGDGNTLYMAFDDDISRETANFNVTGLTDVLTVLPCIS
jgi:hypothetical protein